MQWNSEAIFKIISSVPGVTPLMVKDGEDYTTDGIHVTVAGTNERLWVRGFVTDGNRLPATDMVEVEMIEVTTGYSDGDMPSDPVLIMAHAGIQAALVSAGYKPVVNSLQPYF